MSEGNGDSPEIIIRLTAPTIGEVLDKSVNTIALLSEGSKHVRSVEDAHAATGLVIEIKRQIEPQLAALQKRGIEPQDIAAVTERIMERGKAAAKPAKR